MGRVAPPADLPPLARFVAIMRRLLEPDGCPWDRAQTHRSLKAYLVEESYELLDAIDRGDVEGIREELGDVLLQVVFHAELARAAGRFDFDDVARGIAEKVVRRHPHVFGEGVEARTPAEVEQRWEEVKRVEKKSKSLLEGIPPALPMLRQAAKLSERAARVGFDWPDAAGVRVKVAEELGELDEAVAGGDSEAVRHELGDLLFAVANFARHLKHDPEEVLRECALRFRSRFGAMEEQARGEGRPLGPDGAGRRTLEELEAMWEEAKRTRG
ncbi:MAG: nucleoside triphosphate pyrophosphohydrolase [Deltaproteobacteria bacterium]|nr:nucleoside triphosphate pyrophosphohydrolase [Deltaproteobacteria bacterium]